MRLEILRWPLFAAAVLSALKCLFRFDAATLAFGAVSAACWCFLSLRKVHSLDRRE